MQAATIQYLKLKVRMLGNSADEQDEYYRKNMQDVSDLHTRQMEMLMQQIQDTEREVSNT